MHDDRRSQPPIDADVMLVQRRRSRRVLVLIAAIIILSVADLIVTLGHLTSTGMMEANPIAVYLIKSTQSPWPLAAFKGLTVLICVSLLYRLRHHREGEVASWLALVILIGMAFMWHGYSRSMPAPEEVQMVEVNADEENWLRLD